MTTTCKPPKPPTSTKRIDRRKNKWIQVPVSPETQKAFEIVRKDWAIVSDQEIEEAKTNMLSLFSPELMFSHRDVKGMACGNFVYLRSNDDSAHFFIPTHGKEEHALLYDCSNGTGQCEMNFVQDATFDCVVMQSQCM